MRWILATGNAHKIKEMRSIWQKAHILPYFDWVDRFDIIEDADSFEANAIIKAKAVFDRVEGLMQEGDYVLADDSGLSVEALDFAPGIYSARYALMQDPSLTSTDDVLNRQALIKALKQKGITQSKAFYTAALCAMDAKGKSHVVVEHAYGTVYEHERGVGGFGYDSLFVPDGHDCTWAQMPQSQKDAHSHRGKALQKMKALLCH